MLLFVILNIENPWIFHSALPRLPRGWDDQRVDPRLRHNSALRTVVADSFFVSKLLVRSLILWQPAGMIWKQNWQMCSQTGDTVDGWNSAPVEVGGFIPLFTGVYTSQLWQDFLSQKMGLGDRLYGDKAQYLLHLVGQLEFRPWGAIPSIHKWAMQKKAGCLGVYRGLYQAVFSGIIISHY